MACPSSWRRVEIEQKEEYGFTVDLVKKVLSGFGNVKKYYMIRHGRDVLDENGDCVENKDTHIHLLLWFYTPQNTDALIKKFCVDGCTISEQQLEKVKKDESAVCYLTHENVDKPKYKRSDIISSESIDDINTDIDKAVREKQLKANNVRKAEIVDMVDKGIIKPYNKDEYVSAFEWVTYKNAIESAFQYRVDRLRKESDRNMEVVFIYGDARCGKTTLAKRVAKGRYGDSVFISSSSNDLLDGYGGQDVIILDDLRASSVCLSDLLKMTDNHTSSSVKSRFYNKVLECRLLIITSIHDIDSFYRMVFKDDNEPIKQLKGRCRTMIHFTKDKIEYYDYNDLKEDYDKIAETPNFILAEFTEEFKKKTVENRRKDISAVLGGLVDLTKHCQNVIDNAPDSAFEQLSFSDCDNLPFDKTEV